MQDSAKTVPVQTQRGRGLAPFMAAMGEAIRFARRTLGPLLELAIRLSIAQAFFVSGVLKVADWENAVYLATHEYPVSWLDPVAAAWLGALVEIVGPVLLALGLATRFAATAMLALALVIQFNYQALDTHLLWAALLGWFAVRGASGLALDGPLARGLADSALPFAARAVRLAQALRLRGGPVCTLVLRLWLALALIGLGAAEAILPLQSASAFPPALALGCALMLALGLGTRIAALAMIASLLAGSMEAAHGGWIALLGLLALFGPGRLSLDRLIEDKLRKVFPQLDGKPAFSLEGLPRVVIVGAGFGGMSCAARLKRAPVQVTLIDRHNYHLFQPLLYQVATAALSPGDISATVRSQFRDDFNVRVLLGSVSGVDTERQEVVVDGRRIPYDYLVLATGASHSYFGKDQWAPFAPGLKRIEDATEMRRRLLSAFERAEATEDAAERQALLTFLIVGGGPTGVELAGAIAELARWGMEKEFRRFDPAQARVILVQAGPRILPTFPEQLSENARKSLEKLGVEVMVNARVEQIDDAGVLVNGSRIASRTVLWAAGVVASPAAMWLGADADNVGRVRVGPDLSVPGLPNVFAVGDTALSTAWEGNPVPGLAPAAKQGGDYVARVIRARILGRPAPGPFVYRHLGSLATIGRKAAVADFGLFKATGALAWWFWGLVHVYFLVGLRNRISVMFDWFWAYLTFKAGTRLITGGREAEAVTVAQAEPRRVAAG